MILKTIIPKKKIKIKYDLTKPNGTPRKVLNVSLAKNYGWSAKFKLKDSLLLTYKNYVGKKIKFVKKIIVITGGAGFVGSNLIELFLKKTRYKILSIDNYSSGFKRNHIRNRRVKYIKEDTKNISKILNSKKKKFILCFILENFQEYTKVL